jgi:hypothetical protein
MKPYLGSRAALPDFRRPVAFPHEREWQNAAQ